MLKSVRGALKGVVAWFIIILLILAFALFGVPELQNFTRGAAIKVGDEGIPAQLVLNEFNRNMVNQRAQAENGSYTREDALADGLPDQIVNSLATRSLVEQEATKLGLAMPRTLVREFLSSDERFQNPNSGKFDVQVLTAILQNYQYSVAEFEADMRNTFLREQLVNSLDGGGYAPKEFVSALLLREIEKRDVTYLTMTEDMAGIPEEPTPDKLRTFYDENHTSFTAPEYRTFTLISLRESDFRDGLATSEEELRKIYDIQKPRLYDKPERRTLYQITFDTEAEALAAVSALQQKTPFEKIATDKGLPSLEAVTFTDVAKEDILDPAVAEAAFGDGFSEGNVVEPVKGIFGWTVIQIAGITSPETKTFEEVRDEIEAQYLEQDTQKRIYDALDTIEEARDSGIDIAAAAESSELVSTSYGPVDRFSFAPGGAIIDGIPGEVLAEVFRLEEGEESEAEELNDKAGYFFVTVNEVTPPTLADYETVETDVEARWRIDERTRRITRAVKQVRDALAAGATLNEAATPFNSEPVEQTIERGARDGIFSQSLNMQIFAADKGTVVTGPAPTGDAQTIVVVNDIDFNRVAIGPGQEAAFGQYLGLQLDQELLDAYLQALRQDYQVAVDQEQIDALFNDCLLYTSPSPRDS